MTSLPMNESNSSSTIGWWSELLSKDQCIWRMLVLTAENQLVFRTQDLHVEYVERIYSMAAFGTGKAP